MPVGGPISIDDGVTITESDIVSDIMWLLKSCLQEIGMNIRDD